MAKTEELVGAGRKSRLGKKDSRFGPELTVQQRRRNRRTIDKRSGFEDLNELIGRRSAKQFEDKNPKALAAVFSNKKVQAMWYAELTRLGPASLPFAATPLNKGRVGALANTEFTRVARMPTPRLRMN